MATPKNIATMAAPRYSHEWCTSDPPPQTKLDGYFREKSEHADLDIRCIYKYEANRLLSFNTWNNRGNVYPTSLARAGLYYTGNSDTVTCFACNVKIGQWAINDLPITEHEKHSPHCPYLLGGDAGNVPLETNMGKFSLDASKDNERNILKGRKNIPVNVTSSTDIIPLSEIELKLDQLITKYRCSSLDFTKVEQLRSGSVKSVEEILKKNGFHKNGYQPTLHESSQATGATSLAYGVSNVQLDDAANCGPQSLPSEVFDSVMEAPPRPLRESNLDSVTRIAQPSPTEVDTTEADSVKAGDVTPVVPQPPRTALQPPSRTQHDAVSFTTFTGPPDLDSIIRRIRSVPVYQGLTEYCPKEDLLNMIGSANNIKYSHINDRYDSFEGWAYMGSQDPRSLAEAGFFYTGNEDRVRCFLCNGGLCNWETTDVPWYEHNKWFGRCKFVISAKKNEVIKVIIETTGQLSGEQVEDFPELPADQTYSNHNHDNMPEGMQCDCRLGSVPRGFWRSPMVQQAYTMGFSRSQIESVINRDGVCVTDNQDALLEALLATTPLYVRQRQRQTETDQIPVIQNQNVINTSLNVRQREEEEVDEVPQPNKTSEISTQKDKSVAAPASDPATQPEELQEIEKENEQLKTVRICKICLDTQVQVIFLPCSHLVACLDCSLQLNKCPVCRVDIKATARVYL